MLDIRIVETPGLGDRSYIVTDGQVAVVIDPQRDLDRILEAVGDVPVTHVLETHIHNDYVTGGLALAARCGATYVVNADDPVDFDRHGVRDGDVISRPSAVGDLAELAADSTTTSYRRATFQDLAAERAERGDEIVVLDVRRPDEWEQHHIEGAVHLPFYDLRGRQREVPDGEVWVHCESGYRASIGASLMDCAGRDVVLIDDDWDNAKPAGNPITGS